MPRAFARRKPPLSLNLKDWPEFPAYLVGEAKRLLSRAAIPPRSFCLRVSGAVAPSASARADLSRGVRRLRVRMVAAPDNVNRAGADYLGADGAERLPGRVRPFDRGGDGGPRA